MNPALFNHFADPLYFTQLVVHLATMLVFNLQVLVPATPVPSIIRSLVVDHVRPTNDPLLGGVLGIVGDGEHLTWFRCILWFELLFQLPILLLCARALWKDSKSKYHLLLIYGVSAGTTGSVCLATILNIPVASETLPEGDFYITEEQQKLLVRSYGSYCVWPLIIAWNMANRIPELIVE